MAVQPENRIVNAGIEALRAQGAVVIKIHGSAYSRTGDPDLVGCYLGTAFAIEVKQPHGKLTRIQVKRLEEWEKAGARVGVATSLYEIVSIALGFDIGWRTKWVDNSGDTKKMP